MEEFIENSKILLRELRNKNFLFKIFVLFLLYLLANHFFERIEREDLSRVFNTKPYTTVVLSTNTTFKLLLTLLMIVTSYYFYNYLIVPNIYKDNSKN